MRRFDKQPTGLRRGACTRRSSSSRQTPIHSEGMNARVALPVSAWRSAKAVRGTGKRGGGDRSQSLGRGGPSERCGLTAAATNLCCAEQAILLVGDAIAQDVKRSDSEFVSDRVVGDDLARRTGVRLQVLGEAPARRICSTPSWKSSASPPSSATPTSTPAPRMRSASSTSPAARTSRWLRVPPGRWPCRTAARPTTCMV